jgi:hypothetical protein
LPTTTTESRSRRDPPFDAGRSAERTSRPSSFSIAEGVERTGADLQGPAQRCCAPFAPLAERHQYFGSEAGEPGRSWKGVEGAFGRCRPARLGEPVKQADAEPALLVGAQRDRLPVASGQLYPALLGSMMAKGRHTCADHRERDRDSVVVVGNERWSLYGAPWLQPVATGRKSKSRKTGSTRRKPLPRVATGCLSRSMVGGRRFESVRGLCKVPANRGFPYQLRFASFPACIRYGADYGAPRSATLLALASHAPKFGADGPPWSGSRGARRMTA